MWPHRVGMHMAHGHAKFAHRTFTNRARAFERVGVKIDVGVIGFYIGCICHLVNLTIGPAK